MQPAKTGILDRLESGPSDVPAMPNKVPPSILNAPDELGEAVGGLTLGGGAAMASAPVAGPVIRGGARFAVRHPLITMAGIEAAKQIPYVGKYAAKIPSWLPFLAGGRGAAAAETEAAPAIEEEAPRLIEQMGGKAAESAPLDDAYYAGPRPSIQRGPLPGSPEDVLETKSLQEQVRDAADAERRTFESQDKRDWFARNQPGSTKGELTGTPEKPVKFTKTPGVSLKQQVQASPAAMDRIYNPPAATEAPRSPGDLFNRQFFTSEPAQDVGSVAREKVQGQMGPVPRAKLIEQMGGKPVESITGPKAGTTVPKPGEDLVPLLKKSLKQAVQERGQ